MNFKRICMGLISLVLVACLLVNVSPIKAEAFAGSIAYVTASVVICGIICALGVHMGNALTTVVADTVGDCRDAMAAATDWLTDEDNIAVYSLGMNQYYAHQDMVEWVRQWLFENDYIVESESITWGNDVFDCTINGTSYALQCYSSSIGIPITFRRAYTNSNGLTFHGVYFYMLGQSGCYVNGKYTSSSSLGNYYGVQITSAAAWLSSGTSDPWETTSYSGFVDLGVFEGDDTTFKAALNAYDFAGIAGVVGDISVAEGLETAYIAPSSQALSVGYADWAAGVIDVPKEGSDEPVVYWPLGLAPTVEDTALIPQTNAWQGLSTIDDNVDPPETQPPDDDFGDDTLLTELTTLGLFNLIRRLHSEYIAQQLTDILTDVLASPSPTLDHYHAEWRAMMQDLLSHISSSFQEMTQSLSQLKTQLSTQLSSMTSQLTSSLTQLQTKFVEKLDELTQTATQAAQNAAAQVVEAVNAAVVPDKDYLSDKVNALLAEYAFAESIVNTAKSVKTGLAGITTEPPVIYIHLENTRGSHNIGGTVPFLDLRWYAEYKPTVDTIISAFLWICFAWKMLLKLPGIISGMPGDFVMDSVHHIGMSEHMPVRKAEYEVQRVSSREYIRRGKDG